MKPAIAGDLAAIARARGFGIPAEELDTLAGVLDSLVAECRQQFNEGLCVVEPVGTFHPEEDADRLP